jgi:hypothetical protein
MSWVIVAAGAGAVVSGGLAASSANKAAKAAKGSADASIAESQRQFNLVRGDTAGARNLGNNAIDTISRLYGYGPASGRFSPADAGALPYQAGQIRDDGFFNTGAGAGLNPWTVTSKLGTAGKILDPAGGLLGNIFGGKHGDEKRNLKAFTQENEIYDLGNGMLALADGTQFRESQLQDVAGAWYGATYAPDGNQGEWQQKYAGLIKPPAAAPAAPAGAGAPAAGTGKPDMSVFFESPDYQFNLGEGQKAIDRSAVARGGLLSGSAVKEGQRYASGLASREFASFYDRLASQAGLGQTGIGASAAAGANAAGNIGAAYMNSGNARASAYMQGAEGINNAVQGGISNYMLNRYLMQPRTA